MIVFFRPFSGSAPMRLVIIWNPLPCYACLPSRIKAIDSLVFLSDVSNTDVRLEDVYVRQLEVKSEFGLVLRLIVENEHSIKTEITPRSEQNRKVW